MNGEGIHSAILRIDTIRIKLDNRIRGDNVVAGIAAIIVEISIGQEDEFASGSTGGLVDAMRDHHLVGPAVEDLAAGVKSVGIRIGSRGHIQAFSCRGNSEVTVIEKSCNRSCGAG
ncbi:MAG: hypothetical protein DIKNOCCD_02024 [bacterium]|nr:hypothetical protein [bacterium]